MSAFPQQQHLRGSIKTNKIYIWRWRIGLWFDSDTRHLIRGPEIQHCVYCLFVCRHYLVKFRPLNYLVGLTRIKWSSKQ